MKLCKGCTIDALTHACKFGGPFKFIEARRPDLRKYIGDNYGTALPPKFINGRWHPDYKPFGPIFKDWEEYREYVI